MGHWAAHRSPPRLFICQANLQPHSLLIKTCHPQRHLPAALTAAFFLAAAAFLALSASGSIPGPELASCSPSSPGCALFSALLSAEGAPLPLAAPPAVPCGLEGRGE